MPVVPEIGSYIYIIKPSDVALPEGKILMKQPTVEMLQFGVEGVFELVPLFNNFYNRPCVAFCNENGKQLGLKVNALAKYYWEQSVGRKITTDYLVGNIVVVVAEPAFLQRM